jgi:predicted ATP-grasp superfamily ATP-dependent carboligase
LSTSGEFAAEQQVERIVTFAAMATQMHPHAESRVFGASTSGEQLRELERLEVDILKDGQIGGLNGVLIAAAAEMQMQGICLLGEPILRKFPSQLCPVLKTLSRLKHLQIQSRNRRRDAIFECPRKTGRGTWHLSCFSRCDFCPVKI